MPEKAIVTKVRSPSFDGTNYTIVAEWHCTDGQGGTTPSQPQAIEVSATSFNPLAPTWKQRLQAAIIDVADSEMSITVDDVLFPDLSVV